MEELVKVLEDLGFFRSYFGNFGVGVRRAQMKGILTRDEADSLMEWAYNRGYPHDWANTLVWSR